MGRLTVRLAAFATGFMLLLLMAGASIASAAALPATIKENTTLTSAGNPYTGTSTIESGVTLKIDPFGPKGCEKKFIASTNNFFPCLEEGGAPEEGSDGVPFLPTPPPQHPVPVEPSFPRVFEPSPLPEPIP